MTATPSKHSRHHMKTEISARRSQPMPWLAATLFALSILLFNGCASVPQGSATMAQQALSFTPPPGKAGFYVIRPYEYTGSVLLDEISFDSQECGSVANDTYLFGNVLPGEHTLRVSSPNATMSEMARFTAEAGKNYYFKVSVNTVLVLLGVAPNIYQLVVEPLPEAKGQSYVRQFQLTGDNRFELQN
jgi:hypothetical protein